MKGVAITKKRKKIFLIKYVIADILTSAIAWFCFFLYRKYSSVGNIQLKEQIFLDNNLYIGLIVIPIFWILLYALAGSYKNIYRKSRIGELGQTLLLSIIGVIIIFFALLLDDDVNSYKQYYKLFFVLFIFHFFLTAFTRLVIRTITTRKIQSKKIGFNTIIIGSNGKAINIYKEIENQPISYGNRFIGFVNVDKESPNLLKEYLPHLGEFKQLKELIKKHDVEEVIIAIESNEHKKISDIIMELDDTDVIIKIIPDMHDILLGSVKMTAIFGAPLIQISRTLMPPWQQTLKRIIDIVVSIIAIILLLPVYIFVAIGVKLSSKGPIFYTHERIGHHGKPFTMIKFRSMYVDAEKNGPALSCKNDPRVTPFGRFLRKVRLDEIPQFFSVLIGDMSLVGYRPERQYYIDQIVKIAPQYRLLLKIKPGITSWGQVKYGYAENVEQMVERLKYDLLYLENMSLAVDFKIMIYTIMIVIQGRGK